MLWHHKLTLPKYEPSSTFIRKSKVNKAGQQTVEFRSQLRVNLAHAQATPNLMCG